MGVLALFNPASAHDFDSHQTRVAELLAKKVTVIIQAQYDASTGLMTRHAFERQAASLLGSAGEPARTAFCISTSTGCTSSTRPSACTWATT